MYMGIPSIEIDYLIGGALLCLLFMSIRANLLIKKAKKQISALEQASAHLALALETLNVNPGLEPEGTERSRSAIIGGIAGGGLGAIWGPVGVIAGSGIGSGLGNLAPEALEKAKSVLMRVSEGQIGKQNASEKSFLHKIPFFGDRKESP